MTRRNDDEFSQSFNGREEIHADSLGGLLLVVKACWWEGKKRLVGNVSEGNGSANGVMMDPKIANKCCRVQIPYSPAA